MNETSFSYTGHLDIVKSSFIWVIDNYTAVYNSKKFRECVVSPVFSSNAGTNHKWQLEVFPKGTDMTKEGYWFNIFLVNVSDFDIEASCDITIINKRNQEVCKKFTEKRVFQKNSNDDESLRKSSNFLTCDFMFNPNHHILDDDKLRIVCDITEIELEGGWI